MTSPNDPEQPILAAGRSVDFLLLTSIALVGLAMTSSAAGLL